MPRLTQQQIAELLAENRELKQQIEVYFLANILLIFFFIPSNILIPPIQIELKLALSGNELSHFFSF